MGTLAEIASTIQHQNAEVKRTAIAPEVPKADPQAVDEAKREAQLESQPTTTAPSDERKAERKARIQALKELSDATQKRFVETQAARAEKEKAASEVASVRSELQQIRDAMSKKDAELEAARKDPLSWLQTQGIKLRQLAEAVAKGDAPDAKIEQLTKALQELDAKHEKQMAALKAEYETKAKEAADRETQAAQKAEYAKQRAAFFEEVDKQKEKLPRLMKATKGVPERVIREFMITCEDVKSNPETRDWFDQYSNSELLEATEARLRDMGVGVDEPKPTLKGEESKAPEAKPTLTTKGATESPAAPLNLEFKKMNEKQKIRAMAEMYRAGRKSA